MTKREEWDNMIEKVKNDTFSRLELLLFLEKNKPKAKESRKRLPCVCGRKDVPIWFNVKRHNFFCRCDNCDKEAIGDRFKIGAIRNWNEMIKKEAEKNG